MELVDVTERLMAEFEHDLKLRLIPEVVRQAQLELDCSPAAALPELVERLARQRLNEMVAALPTAAKH